MVKRVLGLDIGDKRIGVAVSDLLGITAQGVETIFTKGIDNDIKRVCELLKQYDTDRVVSGLPMRMSGEEGLQAGKVREFTSRLTELGCQVRFMDERLTSVSAERLLIDAGVRREDRKKVIDKLAATYILQSFLDAGGWKEDRFEDKPKQETADEYQKEVFRSVESNYMESDNIVVLSDEDGNDLKFQHLMTLEYNGKDYIVLCPAEPMDDIGEDEAVILRIEQDDEGNDVYESLTDENELEKVFEKYLEIAGTEEDDMELVDEDGEEDEE